MPWIKRTISAAALVLLYTVLFLWFRSHDVWNISANVPAGDMLAWTTLRLIYVVCLGVACLTAGRVVLMGQTKIFLDFAALEKMLLYFFVGSAVLRMVMFFIGLQGLYKPFFVFFVSLPLLFLFPFVFDICQERLRCREIVRRNVLEALCIGTLCLIAIAILGSVYFGSCQYSFDGDYLTHYGPYYDHVIRGGSLAPNDVWYQYFYSKGAGLFYLSMMITDRTGPLLVSFLHFLAATALIFAIIKRVSGSSLWAISTAIFMLGMMAWPHEGFFIKHHCEISAIILSITCAVVLMTFSKRHSDLCLFVACILQVSLLLYSLQAGIYTLLFITVYMGIALYRRNHGLALKYMAILSLGGAVSVLSMLHNYSATGLYDVTPFRVFLQFWNQEIFAKWVSPYLMLYVSEGSSSEFGTIGISSAFPDILTYARLFRLQKFFFSQMFWLVSGLVCGLGFWGVFRRISGGEVERGIDVHEHSALREGLLRWVMLPSFIMCLLVFFAYVFVRHSISIMRLSEFVSMYVTMFIFSAFIVCNSFISRSTVYRITSILVPVVLSGMVCSWVIDHGRGGKVKVPMKFALGMLTANRLTPVNEKVSDQFPKIRAISRNDRIVSFNLNADYGPLFLQHPGIMTEVSYAFGNQWHNIVFGDPGTAQKALQNRGINFFLVDLGAPMFGAMPYAPLFSGQSLATSFRIVWQFGSRYLLTWNKGHESLGPDFLEGWANNLRRGMPSTLKGTADYGQGLYERVLYLYQLNRHSLHGIVRPDTLQKVEGWQ